MQKYLLYIVLVLLPVFVLPIFPNAFLPAKTAFLVFGVSVALVVYLVGLNLGKPKEISFGKLDAFVFLVGFAYLVSAVIQTPNKMEAFFAPGVATIFVSSALFYFLLLQERNRKLTSLIIFLSGLVLAIATLLGLAGVTTKIPPEFNPIGNHLAAAIYLLTVLPIGVWLILKEKDISKKTLWIVSCLVIFFGLMAALYFSLPKKAGFVKYPDFQTSWDVAFDTLKANPIFGMGPSNYITAFSRFRPIEYNKTDNWNVRFTSASNFYLTVLTETGFLGFLSFTILAISVIFMAYNKKSELLENPLLISILFLILVGLVLPLNPVHITLFFVLLGLATPIAKKTISPGTNKLPLLIASLITVAGIIFLFVYASNLLIAESIFQKSLVALSKNDGKKTFDLMTQAVRKNPYVDRYHASRAQVSMALVTAIAKKKDITEADRKTVAELIQLAIAESKATVTLNPQRSANWELLASTYRAIIPLAKGSDQFTIESYKNAIALDPINPSLRIALGGVYYSLGRFDEAIDAFELATLAKPDLANAHYNLSASYRDKGDFGHAIAEMKIVLSLVPQDSSDYRLAKAELDNLEKRKLAPLKESENLSPPTTTPEVSLDPKLDLPSEATPPATSQ